MLVRTFRLWSVAHDAEARARQWTASYPPSSSSVTSRTRVRTSVAVGEVTASFFFFLAEFDISFSRDVCDK